jgi:hypothetical protein
MSAAMKYELTGFEEQSGLDRVRYAELLILQLPKSHDGRNTWLLNYGVGEEASERRLKRALAFNVTTQAAETITL